MKHSNVSSDRNESLPKGQKNAPSKLNSSIVNFNSGQGATHSSDREKASSIISCLNMPENYKNLTFYKNHPNFNKVPINIPNINFKNENDLKIL